MRKATPEGDGKLAVVESIVRTTRRGSRARGLAVKEAAAKVVLLDGKRGARGVSERMLRGWVTRYEAKGAAGLAPRADRRAEPMWLSARWDAAMRALCDDTATIAVVANAVRTCIRAAWTVGATHWREVQVTVYPTAAALTKAAGAPIAGDWLESLCMLPRRTIERDRTRRLCRGGFKR